MQYKVLYSKQFSRQYKKLSRSGNSRALLALDEVVEKLERGIELQYKNFVHRLSGSLIGLYECHVLPNWLLIYRVDNKILVLELISTGTHAELFE